ncbi:unnamed protein product [Candidula unifasciata]|uniref:C2H2-type domain-containing protein n=1 Tax=Candidula unifasciata TaxID=100452 RepID=A0A8S3YD48_9EUPU|nr:unnamed protein product [Candidula unifasciata]
MDEVSCSDRLHRYSLTIDDVIANFVYIPEPLEEFSLTQEEETAIRNQFESVRNISNKCGTDNNMNYNQCAKVVCSKTSASQLCLPPGSDEPLVASHSVDAIRPPKERPTLLMPERTAESHPEFQQTVDHIDSVLAFVAADCSSSLLPEQVSCINGSKKQKKPKKKPSGDVSQEDSKQKKMEEDSSSSTTAGKNTGGGNELNCSVNEDAQLNNGVVGISSEHCQTEDAGEISKPKKVKKRKSENTGKTQNAHKLSDMCSETGEDVIVKKATVHEKVKSSKKKRTDVLTAGCVTDEPMRTVDTVAEDTVNTPSKKVINRKHPTPKKNVTEQIVVFHADSAVDKAGVCQNRAETSDIGESIASTSGSSEQNTPVHEPESKDEISSSDLQMTDKENHDTGLESGGDDSVRRYKRRLDFVKCDQCSHQARGRSALSRHMKKVHMLDVMMPFRCERCNYGSTKMASLNRHLFTHGVFPCSRCSFVATERVKLTEHTAEQHKDKLDVRMCKVCNRYIKCDKTTIEEHTQECQGPKPYQCTECEKEFKYASSLRVHYHTHFPDQPKRFKCELCDYRTNYKANLHKHNKNMHASRDHDVQCPDCGKLFSTEDNMKRHRKVHTLNRPFSCGTCEKKFKTSGALKGHQLIHTATRPYPCNIPGCSRTFRTPKFLKSHQEEFHHLIPKKFFCSVEGCNYSFFKRSHLKRHTITHTGERNFHCTWPGCSKSFRHSDNLKVHFRAHTNEKPFQCHLCDFKCKQKNSLFWHKKRVHQLVDFSISQRHMEVKLRPGVEHDLKKVEAASDVAGAEVVQAVLSASENAAEMFVSETAASGVGRMSEEGVCDRAIKDPSLGCAAEMKQEMADLPVPVKKNIQTVVVTQEEQGSLDLYEFKSDEDSEDETPGSFRRDKTAMNGLTPLPPPPKELLRKNEILEMKEKEKEEKAEKKEQERIEKAGKKEQEKNKRAEKKNQEKKVKAEQREIERQEKLKKMEQERKEKIAKKELEKKEKEEKKELERKEKLEKREIDKKEQIEKNELKKKEKIEKKQQELKEKIEKREQEQREKAEKREHEKMEKKLTSAVCTTKRNNEKSDNDEEKKTENGKKSCFSYLTRRKSPVPAGRSEPVTTTRKLNSGRKKLFRDAVAKSIQEKSVRVRTEKKTHASSFKKKMLSSKKGEAKKSPFALRSLPGARSVARKMKRVALKRNHIRRCKKKEKLSPPTRKPSARIKANSVKTTTVSKPVLREQTASSSGLHTRKSARKKTALMNAEVDEAELKAPDNAEMTASADDQNVSKSEETQAIRAISDENEVGLNSHPVENLTPAVRSSSPASSEEVMIQGKASPYRDFSDSENQEDHTAPASSPAQKQPEYIDAHIPSVAESDSSASEESDSETVDKDMGQTAEEFSDDEVSNDIPLTPPRAPAPPPMESSDDELELEPELTPFSVPGPSTPFSVPGPNTPFSIPPPTNLMQQQSVHSEDAPMSVLQSVPPVDVHSQGSVDMQQSLESAEMHPHETVEIMNSHGSVDMHHPPGSADSHNSMTVRSHKSVEVHSHGSVEMIHSHGSVEMLCHGSITESVPHLDQHVRTPESVIRDMGSNPDPAKYELPHSLQEQTQTDADKEYFDQYLRNLSAANNRAAIGLEPSPNGLQHLEAMVCKSHMDSKEMSAKSPISCLPTSVITSLESLPLLTNGDLRARMDSLVLDRHHESFYTRDTPSSLSRLSDHQTPLPSSAMRHSPAFDAFSSLNSLAAATGGRENSYLRQPENLFSTPPVTSTFIAEAMFQRQAMATPFLPPQPSERSGLSRIPDAAPLRSSSSSSFLRRPGTVPSSDMFSSPTMAQNMPRHPFANAWTSQEVSPAHWQSPYLAHQSNMATTGSFFPSKDNYLTGRDFMFDPSVRPSSERSMFSSISSSQSQDSYQFDRFDLSNYFPNAMTPYGSSTASLEYSRTAHAGTAKPFDERYRQTAASTAISDYRGLPPTGGSSDMFPGFPGVNSGFSLYAGNAMSYHTPHMTENVNSAFLTHSTSAQHAMFERNYAAAAHRSFYPQNTPYPFVDERQYHSTSKLGHGHPVAPTPVPQERDLISRSAAPESQMQDPYRSLLYRY